MNSGSMMPLISVYVVTFNSSEFVVETLNSIKNQTYQELELIVSDDCSSDRTVEICSEWLSANKYRFVRSVLLESDVNTGVSANCNRAERACHGEWVKCLAGDDLLVPDCISSMVNFIRNHSDAIYVFSRVEAFGADEKRNEYISNVLFDYNMIQSPIKNQLEKLIFDRNYIPAATFFFNREKSLRLGITNDERIPLLDDYPKWINILNKGIAFSFIDKPLVRYRIHSHSLSTSSSNKSFRFRQSGALFFMYYLFAPQFKAKPSLMLLKKLVFAHHLTGVTNPFWEFLMKIYASARKMKGLEPYPPMF